MKIKRFEASSMSEALRMVKKEFGEEAVILSAKAASTASRLLGGKRSGQVVVTAAIDPAAAARGAHGTDGTGQRTPLTAPVAVPAAADGASAGAAGNFLQRFSPITRTGQQKLKSKFVRLMAENRDRSTEGEPAEMPQSIYERLRASNLGRSLAAELADQITAVVTGDPPDEAETLAAAVQIINAHGWVAPVRPARRRTPHIVALVGPAGAGKTATAAKMVGHAVMHAKQSVAVVSLDDQRIAGTVELERLCNLMGVALETARDSHDLKSTLARLTDVSLVVVDTPGLDPDALERRERLADMLQSLDQAEIHLVLNATARSKEMKKVIAFFRPLGVTRLLPTHVDWCDQFGPVLDHVAESRLPMAHLGCGSQMPEGLRVASARAVAARLLGSDHSAMEEPVPATAVTVLQRSKTKVDSGQYVANRNSDIFHHRDCKAVKRINDDNVWLFRDGAEAIEQGFKPCRMCCLSLLAPKPIDRLAHTQYAGGRK